MAESAKFLEALEHDNPGRPRFRIKPKVYENLEISFAGQVMWIPMAEVLLFARRWEVDFESRRAAQQASGKPCLFPCSLMNTNVNDPDCRDRRWWPED